MLFPRLKVIWYSGAIWRVAEKITHQIGGFLRLMKQNKSLCANANACIGLQLNTYLRESKKQIHC